MNAYEQRMVDELRRQLPKSGELSSLRATVRRLRRRLDAQSEDLRAQLEQIAAAHKSERLLHHELRQAQREIENLRNELAFARHELNQRRSEPDTLSERWPRLSAAERRREIRARIAPRSAA